MVYTFASPQSPPYGWNFHKILKQFKKNLKLKLCEEQIIHNLKWMCGSILCLIVSHYYQRFQRQSTFIGDISLHFTTILNVQH